MVKSKEVLAQGPLWAFSKQDKILGRSRTEGRTLVFGLCPSGLFKGNTEASRRVNLEQLITHLLPGGLLSPTSPPSRCRSDSHPTVLCQGLCREHFGGSPDLQVLTSAETGRRHSLRAEVGSSPGFSPPAQSGEELSMLSGVLLPLWTRPQETVSHEAKVCARRPQPGPGKGLDVPADMRFCSSPVS